MQQPQPYDLTEVFHQEFDPHHRELHRLAEQHRLPTIIVHAPALDAEGHDVVMSSAYGTDRAPVNFLAASIVIQLGDHPAFAPHVIAILETAKRNHEVLASAGIRTRPITE